MMENAPMVALTMPSVPKNHKSGSASIRVRPRPAVVDARKSLPSLSKYSYRSLPFASRLHPHGESRRLARRFPIVLMAGTRPGHTTDRVSASLARFVHAARIVNATSVAGVFTADPNKDPNARLLERIRFEDLVRLAGSGHSAAGPSIVFDPVAARLLVRDRTPLSVVHGRDREALRAAILGEPFRGTLVAD